MIVNLIRLPGTDGREGCEAEAAGVPSYRLYGNPFSEAEAEVKRRVLRSLADRANPPANIAFVRTWEAIDLGEESDGHCIPTGFGAVQTVSHPAQHLAVEAFRAEQAEAEAPKPKRQRGGAKR